jgi:hypothetical protein
MQRDWRVDTLRGYCLVCMTLGHFPNPVARFTEYTFGYAAAPDGFVFLSGLVSAWVYLRLREKQGERAMARKVWRRVRDIYLSHLGLMTAGMLFAFGAGAHGFRTLHPVRAFVMGALLLYQGGFDRILPMYCVFLAFTPITLQQFRKNRGWLVLVISATLWITAQFGLGDNSKRLPWLDLGTFNIFAWQAYFIAGQYFGYRGLSRSSAAVKSRVLLVICLLIAILFLVDRHLFWIAGRAPLLGFIGLPNHNWVRFLDAACLGYLLFCIPRSVDVRLRHLRAFEFLNVLGQHSLQVFVFSMLVTRFEAHVITGFSIPVKLLITALTVLSLWLPARAHGIYRGWKRGAQAGVLELART